MKKNNNRIVLTGGHAGTTAISIVEEIKKQNFIWEVHWIGPKKAIEGRSTSSLEHKYFNKLDISFHSIIFGKLQRKFSIWSVFSFLKIPVGFVQALYYLLTIKPKVVLSFGGFASFPVVVISKMFNIPVIIHEQTAVAGRANLLSARFAKEVLLSRETSKNYFSKNNCHVVGNPILSQYFKDSEYKTKINRKTILIMGGSRGSQQINKIIKEILENLLDKYNVIHIAGELDYDEFYKLKSGFKKDRLQGYTLLKSVDPYEMLPVYNKADLVISRAGANSVSELIALGKPSIFIPIPWSYLNEQTKNAQFASKYIPSIILDQYTLTSNKLFLEIEKLFNIKEVKPKNNYLDKEASEKIVSLLSKYFK